MDTLAATAVRTFFCTGLMRGSSAETRTMSSPLAHEIQRNTPSAQRQTRDHADILWRLAVHFER